MAHDKTVNRQKSKRKPSKKNEVSSSQPSLTLVVSTVACLAILVGLYYTNKAANLKKQQQASTPDSRESGQPTVKPTKAETKQGRREIKDPSNRAAETTSKGQTVGKKTGKDKNDFTILPRLDGVKVGHVQKMELEPGKFYDVKTRSLRPPIFEIPDFLTDNECQQIIEQAANQGMETSEVQDPETGVNIEPTNDETFYDWDYNKDGTISPLEVMHNLVDLSDLYFSESDVIKMFKDLKIDRNGNGVMDKDEFLRVTTDRIMRYLHKMAAKLPRVKSRNSRQTWVDHTTVQGLDQRVASLTKLPVAVVEGSEKLQVVNYGPEGHYHCHHDSQDIEIGVPCCYEHDKRHCRLCRYITVLYFLNDVEEGGETAFPVANNDTFSLEAWAAITKYRCDLSKHCHKANLYVKPKKRTAIMWYNHHRDDTTGWIGRIDPTTYHGGCDVTRGRKWIANNWINIMGDSRDQMVAHTDPTKRL
ncbi:transmembrane prolyl 4-hydroxylase-like [Actinia tenebrosa]|uniref:Transmembrane prolyl 4-hydroxylase-like n=1 Tax=Actinia tenebrosa TaxID=6105 RepID=A0A6P8HMW3_ACTTE|nr:transmembrane prolyl 4-hydroxylase-like [Actinia tenebrosa]